MSALVLKNEPVSGARAVEISVFNPSLGSAADHDEDLSGYLYVRPGTYKYALALGTLVNCRQVLTTTSDTIESVDTGTDTAVMTAHAYQNWDGPFDSDEVMGVVAAGTDIWIIVVDENTVAFATTLAFAQSDTRISLLGTEVGAVITSNASTERGVRGKWLYTLALAEITGDVPEVSVAVLGHATLEGGASITISRSGSSLLDELVEDSYTMADVFRVLLRTAAAIININPTTGEYAVRNMQDTKNSHHGTLTASGRLDADIDDAT